MPRSAKNSNVSVFECKSANCCIFLTRRCYRGEDSTGHHVPKQRNHVPEKLQIGASYTWHASHAFILRHLQLPVETLSNSGTQKPNAPVGYAIV
eukprot:6523316-Pyramimonas_sp.AAC.1